MTGSSLPTRIEHLDDMTCLGHVSAFTEGKTEWTELSIYYRDDDDRPFVSVVQLIGYDAAGNLSCESFKSYSGGTIDVAINAFDDSMLRQSLIRTLPKDMSPFPDGNTRRMAAAAERRGYKGPERLRDAMRWLYDDMPDEYLSKQLEADFGVPRLETIAALFADKAAGWSLAFIRALAYFDRGKWRSDKKRGKRNA